MIEKIILDYLIENLEVPVYLELPAGKEQMPYVVIEKTGSSEENFIKKSTFAIQSYSGTMYGAASLNEELKEVMRDMISLNDISKVTINSDYNYTDTNTKKYRYQAVFDITHY